MRTIFFIIQKEFLQIFRNKGMLPILFVVPIVQLIILVNAATLEMKNIKISVVDNNHSLNSMRLISKFTGSSFFRIYKRTNSVSEAKDDITEGKVDMILVIPEDFDKELAVDGKSKVQFLINSINGISASLINAYATAIVNDYNRQYIESIGIVTNNVTFEKINISYSHWYNPELKYKPFMVPGILVMLVTIISFLLSGMNIVREKEMGTIEQVNVTPIKKYQFIAGKLIPFWILALFELSLGLTIGYILYHVTIVGSIALIFLATSVYATVVLGMGLLVSTVSNTQQQSIFLSFFFIIVFVLMSGLFTPAESMPAIAQKINNINPVAHYIRIMRMVIIKGSGFRDVLKDLVWLCLLATVSLSLAIRRYRKTT